VQNQKPSSSSWSWYKPIQNSSNSWNSPKTSNSN